MHLVGPSELLMLSHGVCQAVTVLFRVEGLLQNWHAGTSGNYLKVFFHFLFFFSLGSQNYVCCSLAGQPGGILSPQDPQSLQVFSDLNEIL